MSDDPLERVVRDLRIQIDATLCVAFGDCIDVAPEAFQLDGNDVVAFVEPDGVGRERLLSACDVCPVDALTVWSVDGTQLVP